MTGFEMRSAALLQFRSVALHPPEDCRVIDLQTPFPHDFFEISVTECRAQIPAHTQQNDLCLEVTPFEQIRVVAAHEGNLFRSFLLTLADQLPFLQHYLKQRYSPIRGFGNFSSASQFCRTFDELCQFFRFRTTMN
jgi:hypothetical protein